MSAIQRLQHLSRNGNGTSSQIVSFSSDDSGAPDDPEEKEPSSGNPEWLLAGLAQTARDHSEALEKDKWKRGASETDSTAQPTAKRSRNNYADESSPDDTVDSGSGGDQERASSGSEQEGKEEGKETKNDSRAAASDDNDDELNLFAPGSKEHEVYQYITRNTKCDEMGATIMVSLPGQEQVAMNMWQLYNHLSALRRLLWSRESDVMMPPCGVQARGPYMMGMQSYHGPSDRGPPGPPQPGPNRVMGQYPDVGPKHHAVEQGEMHYVPKVITTQSDGYKWRKYGQKGLKSPDGRVEVLKSYYRCNVPGCPMRKQVERCVKDDKVRTERYLGTQHTHQPMDIQPGYFSMPRHHVDSADTTKASNSILHPVAQQMLVRHEDTRQGIPQRLGHSVASRIQTLGPVSVAVD